MCGVSVVMKRFAVEWFWYHSMFVVDHVGGGVATTATTTCSPKTLGLTIQD